MPRNPSGFAKIEDLDKPVFDPEGRLSNISPEEAERLMKRISDAYPRLDWYLKSLMVSREPAPPLGDGILGTIASGNVSVTALLSWPEVPGIAPPYEANTFYLNRLQAGWIWNNQFYVDPEALRAAMEQAAALATNGQTPASNEPTPPCRWCKGTGKIQGLQSEWPCTECASTAEQTARNNAGFFSGG